MFECMKGWMKNLSRSVFLAEFWSLSSYGTEWHFPNLKDINIVCRMGVPYVPCVTEHSPYTCHKVPISCLLCCPIITKSQLNHNWKEKKKTKRTIDKLHWFLCLMIHKDFLQKEGRALFCSSKVIAMSLQHVLCQACGQYSLMDDILRI